MWNLIPRKLMPPTRRVRYCCQWLKEDGGDMRWTVTGVRWAESVNRAKNQGLVTIPNRNAHKALGDMFEDEYAPRLKYDYFEGDFV